MRPGPEDWRRRRTSCGDPQRSIWLAGPDHRARQARIIIYSRAALLTPCGTPTQRETTYESTPLGLTTRRSCPRGRASGGRRRRRRPSTGAAGPRPRRPRRRCPHSSRVRPGASAGRGRWGALATAAAAASPAPPEARPDLVDQLGVPTGPRAARARRARPWRRVAAGSRGGLRAAAAARGRSRRRTLCETTRARRQRRWLRRPRSGPTRRRS
mmetsp:Transcript_6468/g.27228  ORF Transcript_6468/g.27228 Transcript_6468/m.27228 type:complete len:213 (+) Transcript_6468:607-1245(+)